MKRKTISSERLPSDLLVDGPRFYLAAPRLTRNSGLIQPLGCFSRARNADSGTGCGRGPEHVEKCVHPVAMSYTRRQSVRFASCVHPSVRVAANHSRVKRNSTSAHRHTTHTASDGHRRRRRESRQQQEPPAAALPSPPRRWPLFGRRPAVPARNVAPRYDCS